MAAEERKPFLLRIDRDLWNELEKWAAAELRSVNGQIEFLLRDAVRRRIGSKDTVVDRGGPR
jgi:hypothetical protein